MAEAGAGPPQEIAVGPPFFRFSQDEEFERLLRDQRLEGVHVRTVSFPHPVRSPEELWRGLLGGSVRTSALIVRQTDDMQLRIRAAFDRIVQAYAVVARLELPVSVKLASASKPPVPASPDLGRSDRGAPVSQA